MKETPVLDGTLNIEGNSINLNESDLQTLSSTLDTYLNQNIAQSVEDRASLEKLRNLVSPLVSERVFLDAILCLNENSPTDTYNFVEDIARVVQNNALADTSTDPVPVALKAEYQAILGTSDAAKKSYEVMRQAFAIMYICFSQDRLEELTVPKDSDQNNIYDYTLVSNFVPDTYATITDFITQIQNPSTTDPKYSYQLNSLFTDSPNIYAALLAAVTPAP